MSSTEVQPPSPSNSLPKIPDISQPKRRAKQPPPAALQTQSSRHKRGRSHSFSELVARVLPSNRGEKGHTLREEFKDDGTQNPVDLVFGLLPAQKQQTSDNIVVDNDGGTARKTRSWSPRKNTGRYDANEAHEGVQKTHGLRSILLSIRGNKDPHKDDALDLPASFMNQKTFEHVETPVLELHRKAEPVDIDNTKARQLFEEKKASREYRRSLRESGDFLGIQGANPRTGYWDFSDGTTSSQPSQISEDTRRSLEMRAREAEEQKRRYQEAEAIHKSELERALTRREQRKKEKRERKKLEQKMDQRRHGKWKPGDNGWSSVAEPRLSPIVQSLAGTPLVDMAKSDLLFPMPSGDRPSPYAENCVIQPHDYFGHRAVSSPLAQAPSPDSNIKSLRDNRNANIRRKPVGSPVRREVDESSSTIVRSGVMNTPQIRLPVEKLERKKNQIDIPTTMACNIPTGLGPDHTDSFLDQSRMPIPGGALESAAIATSYQPISMRKIEAHLPLAPNPLVPIQGRRLLSMKELPPIHLKDPLAARTPPNYSVLRNPLPIWPPPTIPKTEPDLPVLSTNISTIITTGFGPPRHLPAQFDGPHDTEGAPVKILSQQQVLDRVPLRASSQPKAKSKVSQKNELHAHPASTGILSEHQLDQTKQRTKRLCQTLSPDFEVIRMKNIPTSTYMSLQAEQNQRNRGLGTIQRSTHERAVPKSGSLTGDALTRSKPRSAEGAEIAIRNFRTGPANDRSETDLNHLQRLLISAAARTAIDTAGPSDRLVIWHPGPEKKAEKNSGRGVAKDMKANVMGQKDRANTAKRVPKLPLAAAQIVHGTVLAAWVFVEPIFNPQSTVRKRFDQQRATWKDFGLLGAAMLFGSGVVLILAIGLRMIGVIFGIMKGLMALFRLLIGV